ncbi:MAG: signal peptidase II [Candidatus Sumerlaeia bacterium]|nr:signal peptidase II [Candidatus Sumerlaeia bacterium]
MEPQSTPQSPPTPSSADAAAASAEAPAGGFAFWRASAAIFLVGFIVDHATKFWAESDLKPVPGFPHESIVLIPGFFNLTYAENTGAAFSIMSGHPELLALVSLAVSAMLGWFWYTLPAGEKWARGAIALILSGAIGNVIDRLVRGFVVDFFHAYWRDHHWPIFNVADSAICVGAAIVVWRELAGHLKPKPGPAAPAA